MKLSAALIDHTRVTCNDVHTIAATLGIEAARSTLVREISGVFG
jgi:hypothetical protein